MATNWAIMAKKVYQALQKDGMPITIIVYEKDGAYSIADAKRGSFTDEYPSHGIIKAIEKTNQDIINPEESEMIFHAGTTIGDIPNLLDKDKIQINADNKIYEVVRLKAIRPAGVTLMYKAIIKESEHEV